jgi:hypothetical protein
VAIFTLGRRLSLSSFRRDWLVLGPDSSLGPMIAATILPLIAAQGDAKRAVALAIDSRRFFPTVEAADPTARP